MALAPPYYRAAATSAVLVVTDFRSGFRRRSRDQVGLGDGHGRDGAANGSSGAGLPEVTSQEVTGTIFLKEIVRIRAGDLQSGDLLTSRGVCADSQSDP